MHENGPETAGFRLSPQQEQLIATGTAERPVQCAVVLEGPVDEARLGEALASVVGRHEILRTTFVRPVGMRSEQQAIADELPALFAADGEPFSPGDWARLERLLEREGEPFDLAHGPIVRARLVGGPSSAPLLILSAPAAVADPASMLTLTSELADAYRGEPAREDPLQYADYAQWRYELIAGEDPEATQGATFWREDSTERPEPPRLLFGTLRPGAPGPVASASLALGAVGADLEAAARNAGVSGEIFLEAAWHGLIARLSGSGEFVLAGWFGGRAQPDLEGAVGPYAQPAPIRTRIGPDTTFAEILDQVRRSRALAGRSQDFGGADELAALQAQARIGFADLAIGELRRPVRELVWCSGHPAALALMLELRLGPTALEGEVRYDRHAFEHADAEQLAARYVRLLAAAIADPSAPLSRLPVVDPVEREEMIAAAAGPPPVEGVDAVHHLFERAAARSPELPAVDGVSGPMSYAELNAAANRMAHYLRAGGQVEDRPVGLCMERTPAMLVALLGILKAGGAYLPLNFDHPPARLAHQLAEAGAGVLVTQESLLDRLPEFTGQTVCVERDAHAIAAAAEHDVQRTAHPDELAYVMYTSGSTGTPKGVAVTHGNLANYARSIVSLLAADGRPAHGLRFGVVSAISTDLGNTGIFPPLVSGGCVHLTSAVASMNAEALAGEVAGTPLDAMKITPSHLRALLADGSAAGLLPRQWLILGGEALSWDLVAQVRAQAPGCRILNHYGPTETTVGACAYPVGDERRVDATTVPIGFPLAGARTYVLDDQLEPLPAGVPGELCIGGVGVAAGYVGAQARSDRFVPDPFSPGARMYRTGDRARRLRDGAIEFLGRLDEQVKIRGYRVEPAEIEAALVAHPAIRQAAVNAEPDERGTLRLVGYLVSPEPPSVEELQAFLARTLPEYMIPPAFATLEALPFTPSGKVDRKSLAGLAETQTRRAAQSVAPRDEIEVEIAGIWASLLGVDEVGVFDDFFALGGHSLMATQAIMRIRRAYGDIPLRALLAAPTVAALAEVVRASGAPAERST